MSEDTIKLVWIIISSTFITDENTCRKTAVWFRYCVTNGKSFYIESEHIWYVNYQETVIRKPSPHSDCLYEQSYILIV